MDQPDLDRGVRAAGFERGPWSPPPPPARRPPSSVVVKTILFLNVAVFLLWWMPGLTGPTFMVENFLVSWPHVAEGRVWVLLTSVFSHNLTIHLLVNMIVLTSFGTPLEHLLGPRRFLVLYLIAGVMASLAHVATSRFLIGEADTPALGASGALAAILMLFAFSFPKARVLLFFIIPLPAIAAALAFVALDVWGLVAQIGGDSRLPIGHGAHLGGALTGFVYWTLHRGALRERRRRLEAGLGPA